MIRTLGRNASEGLARTVARIRESPYRIGMEFTIRRFAEVGSTMETAKVLIDEGFRSPAIIMADRQMAGRGRIEGRRWEGTPGASLLMTLCFRGNVASKAAPPLRVGLGVIDALTRLAGPAFGIKWPNDIMGRLMEAPMTDRPASGASGTSSPPVAWGKLGGLLCEVYGDWFLAGIGLNLRPAAFSPELATKSSSVEEAARAFAAERARRAPPAKVSGLGALSGLPAPEALAVTIGEAVARRLESDDWRPDYERLLWARGEEVSFVAGHPERGEIKRGRIRGIDEAGRLVLTMGNGKEESFHSGEISSVRSL